METINERVRILREDGLKMTQKEFAQRLNLETSNSISMIERGKNTLTKQNIEFICTKNRFREGFAVNETWLRSGHGEMFVETLSFPLEERLEKLKADERDLIEIFDKLYANNQLKVIEYAQEKLDLQELREQTGTGEKGEYMADTTKKIG